MTNTDAPRLQASEVALNPTVDGHDNVQAAIQASSGGGVTLGNWSTDDVSADASTPLTADGGTHPVLCIVASPPAWMDNAGNITAPGMYNVFVVLQSTGAPTTPGQYVECIGAFNVQIYAPCDGMGASNNFSYDDVQSLAAGDLPVSTAIDVFMPTDVTFALSARAEVIRLAY